MCLEYKCYSYFPFWYSKLLTVASIHMRTYSVIMWILLPSYDKEVQNLTHQCCGMWSTCQIYFVCLWRDMFHTHTLHTYGPCFMVLSSSPPIYNHVTCFICPCTLISVSCYEWNVSPRNSGYSNWHVCIGFEVLTTVIMNGYLLYSGV